MSAPGKSSNGPAGISTMSRAFALSRIARHLPSRRAAAVMLAISAVLLGAAGSNAVEQSRPPNIIFILADDLGYGDLGCYGQQRIRTPRLDQMAQQGIRFTQCYSGSTVCAPSRCALMTGLHCGHARIRANSLVPLRPEDVTAAKVLKSAGYDTAIIGKWGLGEPDTTGVPNRQGFDYWFGYLNQVHAHNYYPDYLWLNETKFPLPDNVVEKGVARVKVHYSPDLFTQRALDFVSQKREQPFFLYLTYIIPHANNEAGQSGMETPTDAPYAGEPWPQQEKNKAAMISRLDADVGKLLDRLRELHLAEDTVVFFSSDNGPHQEGGVDPTFHRSSGPLRGHKRDLYDGGIRVPLIAWGPNRVPEGSTNHSVVAFWDFLPTAAELAGAPLTAETDGVSWAPVVNGKVERLERPAGRDMLYWEFNERGDQQAARLGKYKALKLVENGPLELYDLETDCGETKNIAADHPQLVEEFARRIAAARTPPDK